jgi:hypothetical protein
MNAEQTAAPDSATNTAPSDAGLSFGDSLDSFFSGIELQDAPADMSVPGLDDPTEPTEAESTLDSGEQGEQGEPIDDVEETVQDWTPQAARRFKELKAENKQAKARAVELESQMAEREARLKELEAVANDPKIKDMTSRAEDYERALLLNDLEKSPAYRKLVSEPLEEMTFAIDHIAAKYGVDGDELIELVVQDDEAAQEERLSELLANASDRDKFQLYKIIEDIKPVLNQRQALHENAAEALAEAQELENQRQQVQYAERARHRAQAASEVAKKISAKLPFIATFDGVDMNALTKQAAETDYTRVEPAVGAYQTMAGRLLPALATQYIALQRELGHLTDRLAEYDNAGSPLNGGSSPSYGRGGDAKSGASFVDAVEAAFR